MSQNEDRSCWRHEACMHTDPIGMSHGNASSDVGLEKQPWWGQAEWI